MTPMLKIYGIPLSPFVRKVHWALAHKDVEFEYIPTMPGDESPEYRAISPLGKIPALEQDGFSVSDSSIILSYLETQYSQNPLYPEDAQARAFVCWLEEFADTKLVETTAVFFRERFLNPNLMKQPTDQDAIDEATTLMPPLLSYLESVVQEEGYFTGDSLSVADLAITSAFVNGQYGEYTVDADAYPKLADYVARAMQAPLVTNQLAKEQEIIKSMGF